MVCSDSLPCHFCPINYLIKPHSQFLSIYICCGFLFAVSLITALRIDVCCLFNQFCCSYTKFIILVLNVRNSKIKTFIKNVTSSEDWICCVPTWFSPVWTNLAIVGWGIFNLIWCTNWLLDLYDLSKRNRA